MTPYPLLTLLLAPIAAAQQPTCTQTSVVFAEDFAGGVPPQGWVGHRWIPASASLCGSTCGNGLAAKYFSTSCDCATFGPGCGGDEDLVGPWIALPAVGAGQSLVLDFCFQGYLDTNEGDCNQLEIEHAGGTATYKLGLNIFAPCPGPSFLPPFDLGAYAGQSIRLTFHAGEVDPEGVLRMSVDDVSIVLYDAFPSTDCDANGMPDGCDLVSGAGQDCDGNLVLDACDIASGSSADCNDNGVPDPCDLAAGTEQDCDADGVLDVCSVASGAVPDCNANGVPDSCDIASGTSHDFDGDGQPDECQCANSHLYCVGGVNSLGKKAAMDWSGSTSITLNQLVLEVADARPHQFGIFILGAFKTQTPFGGGFLCLTGSISRLLPPVILDAAGTGAYAVDFSDASSPASSILPLSEWNFQFWYRDPQAVGPQFNLSDAAHLHFCP